MAIALDNSAATGAFSATPTLSSFAVGSGSNRFLLAAGVKNTNNTSAITSITFNGTSLTAYGSPYNNSSGQTIYLYYMVAPPNTTADVVLNSAVGADDFMLFAASFTGVDQGTPIRTEVQNGDSFWSSGNSTSITLQAGELGVDIFSTRASSISAGGSQTVIQNVTVSSTLASSYRSNTGSTSFSWTWAAGQFATTHRVLALASASLPDMAGNNKLGVHQGVGSQPYYFYGG